MSQEGLSENEKYVLQVSTLNLPGAPENVTLEKVHTRKNSAVGRDHRDIPMTGAIINVKEFVEGSVIQVDGIAGTIFYEPILDENTRSSAEIQFRKQKELGDQFRGIDFSQVFLVKTLSPKTRGRLPDLPKVSVKG